MGGSSAELDSADLSEFSGTLPPAPEAEIDRTPAVNVLYAMLGPERRVVLVEGPGSSGKTVLLAQFVRKRRHRCISFFVGTDFWSSRPRRFLVECCQQMVRAIPKYATLDVQFEDMKEWELVEWFEKLYTAVARKGRQTGDPYVFVVDALDRVPESHGQTSVTSLLPGSPLEGVYVVVSCTPGVNLPFRYEKLPMPFLSQLETEKYFSGMLDPQQAAQVYKMSSGLPGYLVHVRRQLERGAPAREVISNLPEDLSTLYERDWERLGGDSLAVDVLSYLAFSPESYSMSSMSDLVQSDCDTLRRCLSGIGFISANASSGVLEFVTDSHRKFVAGKLASRRYQTETRLIEIYERDPSSRGALEHLPMLYEQTRHYDKLKELVDTDYLIRAITTQPEFSLSSVRRGLRVLADMAYESRDWETLAFASLADSVFETISRESVPLESKIDALLAQKKYEDAVRLAFSCRLPADRLRMLSDVCRALHEQGVPISGEIVESLENALQRVVPAQELQGKLFDAAANIFPSMPNLAIKILECMAQTDMALTPRGHLMDVLLSGLVMYWAEDGPAVELQSYIKDESLRDFARAASPLMSRLSADEVLRELAGIRDTSAKLFLLRSWCNANPRHPDAHQIVACALRLLTESVDYTPSMRDLRQIAEPLAYAPSLEPIEELVRRIDIVKDTLVASPVEEKARLDLVLAQTETRWSSEAATCRLQGVYLSLRSVSEPEVRCLVSVHILLSMPRICPSDLALRDEVLRTLAQSFDELLSDSAEQYRVSRRILHALARYDPDLALAFAVRLNTAQRRDWACEEVLRSCITGGAGDLDGGFIVRALQSIKDPTNREFVLVKALRALALNDSLSGVRGWGELIAMVKGLSSPLAKAYAAAYAVVGPVHDDDELRKAMSDLVQSAVHQIGDLPQRVVAGYTLSSIVAEASPVLAQTLFEWTSREEARTTLSVPLLQTLHSWACELATRVIPDLCKGDDAHKFVDQVLYMIDQCSSEVSKCGLLATLGIRLHLAEDQSNFTKTAKRCLEVWESIQDPDVKMKAMIEIAPLLYEYERGFLASRLEPHAGVIRDEAWWAILRYILSKRPGGDPVDLEQLQVPLDSKDVQRACEVIGEMCHDHALYCSARALVDRIVVRGPSGNATSTVKERDCLLAATTLLKVISKRLPDASNIMHDGYVIAAQACVAELREAASMTYPHRAAAQWDRLQIPSWSALIEAARNIPNTADRVFVLALVGEACVRYPSLAKPTLDEAAARVLDIRNSIDRVERFCSVAEAYKRISDYEAAKYMLEQTLPIAQGMSDPQSMDEVMGRLVELAHSIDPNYGASIASKLDNPIVKGFVESDLRGWQLRSNPADLKDSDKNLREIIELGAVRILTSCCSRRALVQHEGVVGKWLRLALGTGYRASGLTVSWFMENAMARSVQRTTPQLTDLMNRIIRLDAMILSIARVTKDTAAGLSIDVSSATHLAPSTHFSVIPVGHRDEAIELISTWLLEHGLPYVKVYDPYFSPSELTILRRLPTESRVQIVTSWKGQRYGAADADRIRDEYKQTWRSISDQAPSAILVYIIGARDTRDSPMHDRYIVAADAGLQLGTSLNGLGLRDSSIRFLDKTEKEAVEQDTIDPIIINPPMRYKDQELIVYPFSLSL